MASIEASEKRLETLKKRLQKERDLEKKHKENADRLQKEIENQQQQEINKAVNKLNLSGEEYKKFMSALRKKQNLMDAIDHIETETMEERKDDINTASEDQIE